jgi:hypothetical protein
MRNFNSLRDLQNFGNFESLFNQLLRVDDRLWFVEEVNNQVCLVSVANASSVVLRHR